MRTALVPLGWTSGWYGKRRRGLPWGLICLPFPFIFLYFCKEGSYPGFAALRADDLLCRRPQLVSFVASLPFFKLHIP